MSNATNQSSAVVGATDVIVLGANLSRKRLTISPPSAGRVTIVFGAPAVLDAGETIYTATAARTWDYDDVGDRLCGEIHAVADAAARTIGILESFAPRG